MIDWARLDELHDDLGAETLQELVDVFLTESDEIALRLAPQCTVAELADHFHSLKGSSANLGLSDVANMCGDAETTARTEGATVEDMAPWITRIRAAYDTARGDLLAGLPMRYAMGPPRQALGM